MATWLTCAIGKVLREKRFEHKLSLAAMSQISGLPIAELGKLERGTHDADVLTLDRAADAAGLNMDQLVQQAHFIDDERIIFIGSELLAQQLKCPARDVLMANDADHARAIMQCWRTDCLVIVDPPQDVLIELRYGSDSHDAVNSSIRLLAIRGCTEYGALPDIVYSTVDELPSTVNQLLLSTKRGNICHLRRVRQQCRQRHQQLQENRSRLAAQVENLITHLSNIRADRQNEQLLKLSAKIEKLRAIQARLIQYEHVIADQDRFLQRREAQLMAEESIGQLG